MKIGGAPGAPGTRMTEAIGGGGDGLGTDGGGENSGEGGGDSTGDGGGGLCKVKQRNYFVITLTTNGPGSASAIFGRWLGAR